MYQRYYHFRILKREITCESCHQQVEIANIPLDDRSFNNLLFRCSCTWRRKASYGSYFLHKRIRPTTFDSIIIAFLKGLSYQNIVEFTEGTFFLYIFFFSPYIIYPKIPKLFTDSL